jgi:tRNA-Thr(GGU) m(6)t(6)A37 methyltransferase TsaA
MAGDPDETSATAVTYHPIGVVESPHRDPSGTPIQPAGARGVRATVRLRPELEPALDGLAGFSHLILVFHCHRATAGPLRCTPYLDNEPHGLFATRSPARPNPIGLSVVRLVAVRGATLEIEDVDLLDGTPVLDVKPFVPTFDQPAGEVRVGWLEGRVDTAPSARADDRFHRDG